MKLTDEDYDLSSATSQRGSNYEGLRIMHVKRLTPSPKAVWRRLLRDETQTNVYCEPCKWWTNYQPLDEFWRCPRCARLYRAEVVIFEEVVEEPE